MSTPTTPGRSRRPDVARPRRRGRRAAFWVLSVLMVAAEGGPVWLTALDSALGSLPPAHLLAADSLVLDRSGALLAELHPPGETRRPVSLDQVAGVLVSATVAVEDRDFWSEGAVAPRRVAAAALHDLAHPGQPEGASTITEQLAKVLYLDGDRSVARRVREMFIARTLAAHLSRREILTEYLNDIPYGHGATGIDAAARVYFGTGAGALDLAHAALLAGLPNAPSALDPFRHMDAARARQHVVLDAMVTQGAVSRADADTAAAAPITLADGSADNVDLAPALAARVAAEVRDRTGLDVSSAGLRITTTVDLHLQQAAAAAVRSGVDALASHHVTDGALVSIDPSDGGVRAWVGSAGADHPGGEIDMAATPRQPGSTFKLATYSAGIEGRVVSPVSPVTDEPYRLPDGGGADGTHPYEVVDYDRSYHGVVSVTEALANSLNVPAVKLEQRLGVATVVDTARRLGYTLDAPTSSYGASLTLGSYAVPLWQTAQAASVLAASGTLRPMHDITSVLQDGAERWPSPEPARQVLGADVAWTVNSMLTDDSARALEFGTGSALTVSGHVVAAKTGTTTDNRDNLTVGWTPHLVTATWVGNADASGMQGTSGLTGAAPVWHDLMSQALSGDDGWGSPPQGVHHETSSGHTGWVLDGTDGSTGADGSYPQPCDGWAWLTGCDPSGQGGSGGSPGYVPTGAAVA